MITLPTTPNQPQNLVFGERPGAGRTAPTAPSDDAKSVHGTPPEQPGKPSPGADATKKTAEEQKEQQQREAEFDVVQKLQARDREVRQHEQAHVAAAGGYVSGPIHYTFQRGPDGQSYAIGGHVNLDISKIAGDPHATRQKAQVLLRAALAPAEPSGADHQIAARARRMMMEAQMEIAKQQANPERGDDKASTAAATDGNLPDQSAPAAKPDGNSATNAAVMTAHSDQMRQRMQGLFSAIRGMGSPANLGVHTIA